MAKSKRPEDDYKEKESHDKVQKGKTFELKTGEIFKLMGYEVEYNEKIFGHQIDILIKTKVKITKKEKYYICECKRWEKPVGIDIVRTSFAVTESLKKESKFKNCEAIIVSSQGFTPEAKAAAGSLDIALHTYNELLSSLMDFDNYLTKLIRDFEGSSLEQLYIEQDFFPERSMEEINSFEFVKQWLEKPDRKQFSLLGDFGTGKTSFARKLAYNMAKEYKKKPENTRIPFFVDLRLCQKALSLHTLIYDQLKTAGVEPVNADIFLKLLAEGKILLIFDAFDEMATMSNAEITLNNFRQLNRAVDGEAKVIITSRTHYFRDKYEVDNILKKQGVKGLSEQATALLREVYEKPEYEIVYLKEFSTGQVKEYLKKALKEKWENAYEKIKSIYNLEDLSSRPVLLDMIVKTLPKIDKKGKDTFNAVHLYEVYTYSWFEREDHRLQITKQGKEKLVEGLACRLWQEGQKSIHYTALSGVLSSHLKSKLKTTRDLEAADYEVRTASFLIRDGDGNYSFAHKSFQEFFIAGKIKRELEKNNYNVLDLRRLSVEIIFFLRHLMENDDQIIRAMKELLAQEYRKNISENALLLFYTVNKMACLDQRFSINEAVEFTGIEANAFRQCLEQNLPSAINLKTAALNGTVLSRMPFVKTDFTGASIENAVLTHSIFEDVAFFQTHLKYTDFTHSVFKGVKFTEADAGYCNFKKCVFENCTFINSGFRLSNYMEATFKNCIVKGNDFTGVGFLGSNFDKQDYPKNTFWGAGQSNTGITSLQPLVNLGHNGPVNAAAISSDNRWIVSASSDNTVKLWDVETGRIIKTFKGHEGWVNSVGISTDNQRLVSASDDNTVKLWDVETGRIIKTFKGHEGPVLSVGISTDNQRLVSASSDNTIKFWDIETGEVIYTIFLLPGDNAIALHHKDNTFVPSSENAARYLFYTDHLARYPAGDLPQLMNTKSTGS